VATVAPSIVCYLTLFSVSFIHFPTPISASFPISRALAQLLLLNLASAAQLLPTKIIELH
jgi:hypothetical protein